MNWKDIERRGEVGESNIKIGVFRLSVHHYIGCGDTWFASCFGVFDKTVLKAKSLEDAKTEALSMLAKELESSVSQIYEDL